MKNATYVDQCDTIRTLTEQEMADVSGGSRGPVMSQSHLDALVRRFERTPIYSYRPRTSGPIAYDFFAVNALGRAWI
jgi:hypothetical protein